MRDQEIIDFYEAYQKISESEHSGRPAGPVENETSKPNIGTMTYSQRQKFLKDKADKIRSDKNKSISNEEVDYFTEEVEIAAQYFYEMGLNEDGVNILIEELGEEEFAYFVYDIAEEYILTEARRSGRIEPVTASGKPFKSGKPTGKSLQRLRTEKQKRRESEEKQSASKPSGLKSSLKRQSAIASAKNKQPKKPGLLDRVAGAVNAGIKMHNAAMSAARETGKTIKKAAGKIGGVAREVGKGASGAARLAGHVTSKGLKEGQDLFDYLLEYLVAEGYAETNEAALAIMANMSEEWKQSIVEGDALRNTIKTLEGKRDAMNANKPGSANTAAPGKQSVGAATYKAYQRLREV